MNKTKELNQSDLVKIAMYCGEKKELKEEIREKNLEVLELKVLKLDNPDNKEYADRYRLQKTKQEILNNKLKTLKPHIDPKLFNIGDYFILETAGGNTKRLEIGKYINNKYWKLSDVN